MGSRGRHRPRPAPASESGSAQVRRRSDVPRVGVQRPGTAQPRNVAGPRPFSLRKRRSCAREGAPTARVRARAPAAARPQEAVRPLAAAAAAAPMPGPAAARRTAPRWQTRPASPAASGPPPARAWPAPRAARGASPPPPPAGRGTHRRRCRRCPSPSPSRCRWGSRSPPAAPGGRFSTLCGGAGARSALGTPAGQRRGSRGALFDFFLPEYSLISTVSAVQVTRGPAARGAAPRSRSTGSAGSGSVVTTAPSAAAAICIVGEPPSSCSL